MGRLHHLGCLRIGQELLAESGNQAIGKSGMKVQDILDALSSSGMVQNTLLQIESIIESEGNL
jgi:hypothetical protein